MSIRSSNVIECVRCGAPHLKWHLCCIRCLIRLPGRVRQRIEEVEARFPVRDADADERRRTLEIAESNPA